MAANCEKLEASGLRSSQISTEHGLVRSRKMDAWNGKMLERESGGVRSISGLKLLNVVELSRERLNIPDIVRLCLRGTTQCICLPGTSQCRLSSVRDG